MNNFKENLRRFKAFNAKMITLNYPTIMNNKQRFWKKNKKFETNILKNKLQTYNKQCFMNLLKKPLDF